MTADYASEKRPPSVAKALTPGHGEPDWRSYEGRPEELTRAVCAWLMASAPPKTSYGSDPHARISVGEQRLAKLVHTLSAAGLDSGTPATEMHIDKFCAWLQACYFDGVSTKEHGIDARRRARHNNSLIEQLCSNQQFSKLAATLQLALDSAGAAAPMEEAATVTRQLAELQTRLAEARAEGVQLAGLLAQIKRGTSSFLDDNDGGDDDFGLVTLFQEETERSNLDGGDDDVGLVTLFQDETERNDLDGTAESTGADGGFEGWETEQGCAKPHHSTQKSAVETTANTAKRKLAVDAQVAQCEATCPAPSKTAQDDAASKTSAVTAALARKLKSLVAQDIQRQLQLQEAQKRQRVLQQMRQQLQEQELAQALQRRAHLATLVAQREAALHQQWRQWRQEQQQRRQEQLQAERAHAVAAAQLLSTYGLVGHPPMHRNCRRHWPQQWQTMAPVALGFPLRAPAVLC